MAIEIKVPPLGESLVDAVVGQWLKSEGDAISRGETILELETDKVNLDVTAEDDGVLGPIQKQEGDTVTVGEVLGMLEAGDGAGGNGQSEAASAGGDTAVSVPDAQTVAEVPESEAASPVEPTASPRAESSTPPDASPTPEGTTQAPSEEGSGGRAAPAVRRMAAEYHIDLSRVTGSGPGGRITRDDLLAYAASQASSGRQNGSTAPAAEQATAQAEAQPPAQPQATPASKAEPVPAAAAVGGDPSREERVRLSRRRQTIATRLVQAQQTAAMLTTFNEIDLSAVMEVRSRRKDAFKERHGVGLGFMSFFSKAAIGALKAFPQVNSELQGNELVLKNYYDIGIAVGVEEGLVVPVVRDADRKSFAEIEREILELATRARDNTLSLAELQGGTFTITNGGVFGSLLSTPILNTPQVGILGMHTIQQRPVARDGEVVIRPMMYVALSYDHRVVDGREAVQFLVKIKELIEDPESLLLEG
ncbi:MAG TPA: 2-oxoglutarate dehydrogenase complex dihydrolipoyllysine-residue succinyltransferase [Thermomicrobiales bacterium]|nr:2-oxoglutarate dehydrogenase complex dihydrolipoyllysine-residue succinyltransferase [Thermomicrobiales bacterium]